MTPVRVALTVLAVALTAGCGLRGAAGGRPGGPAAPPSPGRPVAFAPAGDFRLPYEPHIAAVDPAGRWLAVSGPEPFIEVYELSSGARRARLVGHRVPPVGALAFVGPRLVSGGGAPQRGTEEPTIRVWDLETGALVRSVPEAHTGEILALAVTPDGRRVLSAGTDSLKLWSLDDPARALGMWVDHTSLLCGMAAADDLGTVVTAGRDHRLLVRRARAMHAFDVLLGHSAPPCGVRLDGPGQVLASWDLGPATASLRTWDLGRLAPSQRLDVRGRVLEVTFGRAGPVAAIVGSVVRPGTTPPPVTDAVTFVAVERLETVGVLPGVPKLLAATADGRTVVSLGWDGSVRAFRAE
jgi:WD40 repeat protein